jgi:hypothetical protein
MSELRTELEKIAATFVSSVLAAMKSTSLADLASEAQGAGRAPAARPARTRRPGRPAKGLAFTATAGATRPAPAAARPAKSGKRYRASAEEVTSQKKLALDTARTLKPGFAKGEVMKKSGSKTDLGRALSLLVAEGQLTKKGDRRKTRYWVK